MEQQLTGPDYLMFIADKLTEKPYADAYIQMLFDAFPDEPESQWSSGQRVAAAPPNEQEALPALVAFLAAKLAIDRSDWASLEEVLGTGARMAAKFPRYLQATGRA